jgi:chromosome segregation ATPase
MDYWADQGKRGDVATIGVKNRADGLAKPSSVPSALEEADAAVDLVYEAAESFKAVQDDAADRVAYAESRANEAIRQLKIAEARAHSSEAARVKALAELADMSAAVAEVRQQFEQLRRRAAENEAKLNAAEERAAIAENQANQTWEALERVVDAVRTQLPQRKGS